VVNTLDINPLRGYSKNEKMGFIIFSIGVLLQVLTFSMAVIIFLNPGSVEGFSRLVDVGGGVLSRIIMAMSLFTSLILLAAMGIIGGLIGKYGIELSRHRSPEGLGDE